MRSGRDGGDEAVGARRLGRTARSAGDLLVDAGHGDGKTGGADVQGGGHRCRCVEQSGIVGGLGDRHGEGDQPMPGSGDVGDARRGRCRLRPRHLRDHRGEVLAPEPPVGRRSSLAGRLAGRLDDLARAEDERRRGRLCGSR